MKINKKLLKTKKYFEKQNKKIIFDSKCMNFAKIHTLAMTFQKIRNCKENLCKYHLLKNERMKELKNERKYNKGEKLYVFDQDS